MADESQYRLRIPADLKAKIEEAADEAHRSMNAEIVARLEASFDSGAIALADKVSELDEIVADHVKDIAELWIHIDTLQAYVLRNSQGEGKNLAAAGEIREVKDLPENAGAKGRKFKLPKKRPLNLDDPE